MGATVSAENEPARAGRPCGEGERGMTKGRRLSTTNVGRYCRTPTGRRRQVERPCHAAIIVLSRRLRVMWPICGRAASISDWVSPVTRRCISAMGAWAGRRACGGVRRSVFVHVCLTTCQEPPVSSTCSSMATPGAGLPCTVSRTCVESRTRRKPARGRRLHCRDTLAASVATEGCLDYSNNL